MSRLLVPVVPVVLALLLPSCGGSEVSCSYESAGVMAACADYEFSGDSQGQDIHSLEEGACTSGGGTVTGSCPTTKTLGNCTITDSTGTATVTAVEYFYSVGSLSAAAAQAQCVGLNGTNGLTTKWSAP